MIFLEVIFLIAMALQKIAFFVVGGLPAVSREVASRTRAVPHRFFSRYHRSAFDCTCPKVLTRLPLSFILLSFRAASRDEHWAYGAIVFLSSAPRAATTRATMLPGQASATSLFVRSKLSVRRLLRHWSTLSRKASKPDAARQGMLDPGATCSEEADGLSSDAKVRGARLPLRPPDRVHSRGVALCLFVLSLCIRCYKISGTFDRLPMLVPSCPAASCRTFE